MLIKEMTLGLTAAIIAFCAGVPTQSQCPKVVVNNHTKKWTRNDQKVLDKANLRCKEIYPDAPCLKRFDKLDENRYTAVCGN